MASKTHGEAESASAAVADALDGLYAAPFDDFVTQRRELAAALRAAGDVAASRLVAAAAKPSRTAWALNQVARRRPELLRAALRGARAGGGGAGDGRGRGSARHRTRVPRTPGRAGASGGRGRSRRRQRADHRAGPPHLRHGPGGRRRRTTPDVRETLLAGRLVADIDVDDPFAGLELGRGALRAHARDVGRAARRRRPPRGARARGRARAREGRASAREAREREQRGRRASSRRRAREVAALEEEAREARVAAREAEVAAGRAQAEAERLRRAVEAVEKRLSDAKGELRSRSK